jgi:hypothetical protein
MGFQQNVNSTPAPAVAGDFASANPRTVVLAGPGGFVAGAGGVTVGKFAWLDTDGRTVHNYGTAPAAPAGFVHREQQALISQYPAEASNVIPVGFPVILHNGGDFWVNNSGPSSSTIGEAIYATYGDGSATMGAAATGASVTGAMGSTNTASLGATFTASAHTLDATRIDVTAVTGLISIGDTVAGSGISGAQTIVSQDTGGTPGGAGTYVISDTNTTSSATCTCYGNVVKVTVRTNLISLGESISGGSGFPVTATVSTQVSGTAGDTGVYTMSARGTGYVASATGVTTFGNVVNVTAIGSGIIAVGDPVTGAGLPSNASFASQVSGTPGGVGVYTLDLPATAYAASTTLTIVAGVLASWKAASVAAVGELVKITTWA